MSWSAKSISLGKPSVAEEAKDYDPTEEEETSTGAGVALGIGNDYGKFTSMCWDKTLQQLLLYIYIYTYVYMCICVYVST